MSPILAPVSDEHFDQQTAGGVAASLTAGAAGAAAGLLLAGPAGMTAGALTGPAVQALINYAGLRFERARQKAARALVQAADESGVSEDQFLDMAESSAQKSELAVEALNAAACATTEQKLRALASALSRGVGGDDNQAAKERMVVAALADLEPLHVAVLSCLNSPPPEYPTEEGRPPTMFNRPGGAFGWTPGEVIMTMPEAVHVGDAIFATLQRHGLVVDTAIGTLDYSARYALTEFGVSCLRWLELAGSQDDADTAGS